MGLIYKELKCKKNIFKVFIISIIGGLISLLTFSMFNDGVCNYLKEKINSNYEYRIVTVSSFSEKESLDLIKTINAIPYVCGVCEYMQLNGADMFSIDGLEYMPMEEIKGINTDGDNFIESKMEFIEEDAVICGDGFRKGDQGKAIIDEYALISMGVKDYNDILGKKAVIQRGKNTAEVEIIGVYTINMSVDRENIESKFYDDYNRLDIGLSPVIITYDSAKQLKDSEEESISYIQISVDSITHTEWVYNKLKARGVSVFAEIEDINKAIDNIDIVCRILHIVSIILLIIAVVNMISVLYGVIQDNKRWYQMLRIMGYKKWQIMGIVSIEMVILTVEALLIGGMIQAVVVIVLNHIVLDSIGVSNIFFYPVSIFVILAMLLIGCVILICTSLMFFSFDKKEN